MTNNDRQNANQAIGVPGVFAARLLLFCRGVD
jgi:hypothetical protein